MLFRVAFASDTLRTSRCDSCFCIRLVPLLVPLVMGLELALELLESKVDL